MFRPSLFVYFVCAVSLAAAAGRSQAPDASLARAQAVMAQLPLRFEANQGQWDPAVRYTASAGDYRVLLTASGPALSFANAKKMELRLAHSNPAPVLEPLDRLGTRTDYFVGTRAQWHTGIANYSRVRYRGVYPGVDVVYYGNQNQLEYDFELQPGANPRDIRMQFRGAGHVSVTAEGDLILETAHGRMTQKKPVIYQQVADADGASPMRREVAGRYVLLARNTVGVRLERYDRTHALVIDPLLVYSTYMGGSLTDQITAMRLDAKGHLYVTGSTDTGDLTATSTAYNTANAGQTDVFVAIIDTTAAGGYAVTYFTYLGGSNSDLPIAMQIDTQGDVYLTGYTNSPDFPVAGNAVQSTGAANGAAAFVTELAPSLSGANALLYSTFLGGSSGDNLGNGIDIDQQGNIYVIGTTQAPDFPVTATAYQAVLWGGQDAFLAELNPNSTVPLYSTFLGGEAEDDGRNIAVGPNGLVYFAISTYSTEFPLAGAVYQGAPIGGYDIIIGTMDMTQTGVSSLIYCTYFGGSDSEEVRNIAFDKQGNLLLTGYTLSTDFPITPDAMQSTLRGNSDAFVSIVNPSNPKFLLYSTYLGGSDGDVAYGITTDAAGSIYVTGYTLAADFPVTPDAYQPGWGYGIDIFVTKFKPYVAGYGALQYSTYVGTAAVSSGYSIVVGPDQRIYVGGFAEGNLYPTANAQQGAFGGGYSDGFIMVFSQP